MSKSKRPRTASTRLKKKNEVGLMAFNFKTYYTGTVIKTVCYWGKKRHTDQWNKKESAKMDPVKFSEFWKLVSPRSRHVAGAWSGETPRLCS